MLHLWMFRRRRPFRHIGVWLWQNGVPQGTAGRNLAGEQMVIMFPMQLRLLGEPGIGGQGSTTMQGLHELGAFIIGMTMT